MKKALCTFFFCSFQLSSFPIISMILGRASSAACTFRKAKRVRREIISTAVRAYSLTPQTTQNNKTRGKMQMRKQTGIVRNYVQHHKWHCWAGYTKRIFHNQFPPNQEKHLKSSLLLGTFCKTHLGSNTYIRNKKIDIL